MQKNQTFNTASELLNSSLNVEENHNKENSNSQILEIEPINNSPFHTMGTKENGYCLVIGKYIISQPFDTRMEVLEYLNEEKWNVIANLIITLNYIIKDKDLEESLIRDVPQG